MNELKMKSLLSKKEKQYICSWPFGLQNKLTVTMQNGLAIINKWQCFYCFSTLSNYLFMYKIKANYHSWVLLNEFLISKNFEIKIYKNLF